MIKRTKGFTLVELLVVVAIIALLVSILLPTLGKAKEQAKIVMCLSNLRSLGLSFAQYSAENNDWHPASSAGGGVVYRDVGNGGPEYAWDTILISYYNTLDMLRCPSDNIDRKSAYDDYSIPKDNRYPRSYGMNADTSWMGPSVYAGDTHPWPYEVRKTMAVTDPADTLLLGDMWDSDYSLWYGSAYYHYAPNIYGGYQGSWLGRYGGSGGSGDPPIGRLPTFYHRDDKAANFLFCDGHAIPLLEDDPNLNAAGDYYYYLQEKH